ncbi:general substrate transporter [Penicillium waksmanii]|uniref:general substrate transporter n=1 Tax=Penicillium waksmanii TaxID=69791 RepID=UPI0025492195|nr:general substrate transporter [Penicillium waksmanii]KAJ5984667.1 general substrate transporter [Penicillium waksmanii]
MESKKKTPSDPSLHARQIEYIAEDTLEKHDPAFNAAIKGQATTGYEELGVVETIKTFKLCTLVCFAMAFSAATDGYQIGINASVIANTGFISRFATTVGKDGKPALASPILSGWSAIMSCGQILGMTTLPFLSSRYGRKPAMFTYWIVIVGSVLTECLARSWQGWLVAKFLAGIGVGCLQSTVPTYISEVAPTRIRGGLLMCYSFWWTLGSFFAQVALQHLSKSDKTNYLTPIYTQWAQVGIMLLIYVFIPESPAWCVNTGKHDRAKKQLLILNRGVPNYDLERQFQALVMAVEHEREVAAEQRREKWYAIFQGTNGLRTVISCWTNLSQQLIGLSLFGTFGTYFFQQAGLEDPFKIEVITNSIQIATETTRVLRDDHMLVILYGYRHYRDVGLAANGATGWGYIGEVSSQRLRPYTAGFAAAVTCVAGVMMNVLIPYMTNSNKWNWGLKTGWFYFGVGLPFVVGMWLLIPETSGRSAAELDELFERKIKPWRFHKTETATQRLVHLSKAEDN